MDIKARLKNPYFLVGLVGLLLSTARIDPQTLTSWIALKDALLGVLNNPYYLGSFLLALVGQIINPTTPGLKD